MLFEVDEGACKQAKTPHELAMVNLIVFNLLIGVALLAGSMAQPDSSIARYKWLAVSAPLAISLAIMALTWLRSRRIQGMPWLVAAHWRLAGSRYRMLLAAYLVCGGVLSFALLGGQSPASIEAQIRDLPPTMQEMERRKLQSQDMSSAVWARIGVVPLLLTVMVCIMLESGAIYQAGRGEVPDSLIKRFPPPAHLIGRTDPDD